MPVRIPKAWTHTKGIALKSPVGLKQREVALDKSRQTSKCPRLVFEIGYFSLSEFDMDFTNTAFLPGTAFPVLAVYGLPNRPPLVRVTNG